jgi:hypothetical protein
VAIFAERESHAAYLLQEQEMTRYDAVNIISHGVAKRSGMTESRPTFVEGHYCNSLAMSTGRSIYRTLHALLGRGPASAALDDTLRRHRRAQPNQLKDRDRRAVRAPLRRRRTRSKSGK